MSGGHSARERRGPEIAALLGQERTPERAWVTCSSRHRDRVVGQRASCLVRRVGSGRELSEQPDPERRVSLRQQGECDPAPIGDRDVEVGREVVLDATSDRGERVALGIAECLGEGSGALERGVCGFDVVGDAAGASEGEKHTEAIAIGVWSVGLGRCIEGVERAFVVRHSVLVGRRACCGLACTPARLDRLVAMVRTRTQKEEGALTRPGRVDADEVGRAAMKTS